MRRTTTGRAMCAGLLLAAGINAGCACSFTQEAALAHTILEREYLPLLRGEQTPAQLGMTPDRVRQREQAVAQLGAALKEAQR